MSADQADGPGRVCGAHKPTAADDGPSAPPGLDPAALAHLTYRLAELLGADAPVVKALKQAAESGDPEKAAEAWDLMLHLPPDFRAAAAKWFMESWEGRKTIDGLADGEHILAFPVDKVR
jgi:hypothetical protein